MESHNLYRVKEEDLDKLIRILTGPAETGEFADAVF